MGILVVLGIALLLAALHGPAADPAQTTALVAYSLFTTAVVFSVATISNDNLQDLKTGQLVGATRGSSKSRWSSGWSSVGW